MLCGLIDPPYVHDLVPIGGTDVIWSRNEEKARPVTE